MKVISKFITEATGLQSSSLLGSLSIIKPIPDNNGFYEWKITLPAFALPYDLFARVELLRHNGNKTDWYTVNSKILVTDTTDLNNINLGILKPGKPGE